MRTAGGSGGMCWGVRFLIIGGFFFWGGWGGDGERRGADWLFAIGTTPRNSSWNTTSMATRSIPRRPLGGTWLRRTGCMFGDRTCRLRLWIEGGCAWGCCACEGRMCSFPLHL